MFDIFVIVLMLEKPGMWKCTLTSYFMHYVPVDILNYTSLERISPLYGLKLSTFIMLLEASIYHIHVRPKAYTIRDFPLHSGQRSLLFRYF